MITRAANERSDHDRADDDRRATPALPRRLGLLLVLVTTAAMIAYVWDCGPDPIIDYGRELYLPWRITQGDVLYRDMRYFNGPLAPYVNAALFRAGGVGLRTLQASNAVLILATAALVYHLIRRIAGAVAATAAGAAFPVLFACAHLGFGGTFNWLTPYSTDLTYGIALGLAMMACLGRLERAFDAPHVRAGAAIAWSSVAGVLFGLVLLTKVEVILAAAAGALVMLAALAWRAERARRGLVLSTAGAFVAAAAIPLVIAAAMLARHLTLAQSLGGIFGAWQWVGDDRISRIRFYQWVFGTEDLGDSLSKLGTWALAYAALFVVSFVIGAVSAGAGRRAAGVAAVLWGALLLVIGTIYWNEIPWNGALRPVPLLLVLAGAWLLVDRARPRAAGQRSPTAPVALALGLIGFALVLLAKMLFNVRAPHYGFALVMPATAVAIAVLVGWVPRRLGAAGWTVAAATLAVLALLMFTALRTTAAWVARYAVPVGFGPDEFLADRERGEVVRDLLEDLRAIARDHPNVTLMAVPEGLMINYLARVVNPTTHQNFMPLEMVMYGEDRMLADLAARPPDLIALVHADHEIHGAKFFGRDYGFKLDAWIRARYRPLKLYGAEPYTSERFGILLMQRNPSAE